MNCEGRSNKGSDDTEGLNVTSNHQLPRGDWQAVVDCLFAWQRQNDLADGQADELLQWLQETEFDARHFWIGEIAAALIRDRAKPAVKEQVRALCEHADGWRLYFYLLVLSQEEDWMDRERHLLRACTSPEHVIRSFACSERQRHRAAPQRDPVTVDGSPSNP